MIPVGLQKSDVLNGMGPELSPLLSNVFVMPLSTQVRPDILTLNSR
jgi:hypothetical protein